MLSVEALGTFLELDLDLGRFPERPSVHPSIYTYILHSHHFPCSPSQLSSNHPRSRVVSEPNAHGFRLLEEARLSLCNSQMKCNAAACKKRDEQTVPQTLQVCRCDTQERQAENLRQAKRDAAGSAQPGSSLPAQEASHAWQRVSDAGRPQETAAERSS